MEQQKNTPADPARKPTRLEREAAALRDNLAKRKAQMRQRQTAETGDSAQESSK